MPGNEAHPTLGEQGTSQKDVHMKPRWREIGETQSVGGPGGDEGHAPTLSSWQCRQCTQQRSKRRGSGEQGERGAGEQGERGAGH